MTKPTKAEAKGPGTDTPPPQLPIRQQHKQMTRQRLLDAGIRAFRTRGYADATIDDIVAQAAVGRATFYLHFKSKLEVMRALIQETEQRNKDMIAELKAAASMDSAALRTWLDSFVRHLADHGDLFLVGMQALASEPELAPELENGPRLAKQALAEVLQERRAMNAAEADLRAQLLVSDLRTAVRLLVSDTESIDADLVVKVVAQIWSQALESPDPASMP